LVIDAAARYPNRTALVGPDGTLDYATLDRQANALAGALAKRGVGPGDRVCLWLPKSGRAVVAMQAALRLGAVYVPIDPQSPASRARKIILDCAARCLILEGEHPLLPEDPQVPTIGPGATSFADALTEATPLDRPVDVDPEDLAYILYTSGSTGTPKGVCISHRAALAFIHWAVELLALGPDDHLSSHAPFHFDLSVLDLYAAFASGARVCLIPEGTSYAPSRLVEFIREHAITCWYSVPSALMMMMDSGGLLELASAPARIVFAGEPFPLKHLRRLRERFPDVRMFNFYGPTETNVCTYHEVVTIEPERTAPVPIGRVCCGDRAWVRKADGSEAGIGEDGELIVEGPTVMTGYWGAQPLTGAYATGDIVRVLADGVYDYVGRRDHMVKVRGMRIEIGEIESALLEHPQIEQAAVLVAGSGLTAKLVAYLVGGERPSLIELKRHCAERLPKYMIVDRARWLDDLPRTGNGKIDRKRLLEIT
jgi:clorobiocin biosynthesis protein CloN4